MVCLLTLHRDSAQPLAGACACHARNEHAQRETMVRRKRFSVHGPRDKDLASWIEGGRKGHRGLVAAAVGVCTFKFHMFRQGIVLRHTARQQHVTQVHALPLSIAYCRVPIDVTATMPDEVQLFAPAPAAHQGSPDLASWEPSLELAQFKRPWPLDVTVHGNCVREVQTRDGAVRTNEEQVSGSHVRISQEIHGALGIGLPVPPLCWVPRHPSIRVGGRVRGRHFRKVQGRSSCGTEVA
mmetsp:Transcript_26167/g.68864  ORF Transcript_26167/g.68864 Transcript_26167/m.68864 type:complete len:239 (+) Transcript_26167:689-1405(+)